MNRKYELAPGYRISRVLNGCWQLSQGHSLNGALDMADVLRAFHMLVDRGFTTFDCADIYTGAEDFIGEFVAELKRTPGRSPEEIQIHTKYVPDLDKLATLRFEDTERIIDRSLRTGHPVCWEGDISEKGFSFEKGIATLPPLRGSESVQQRRQREFETRRTTDDHCMMLMGIARDPQGRRYYIAKNSWGKDNPYGGLMYLSEDYVRLKTVLVVMPSEA